MQDLKLEVVVVSVSDIDRSKRFYESLGWRMDADFIAPDGSRGVQLTPPGSPCSIHLRQGSRGGSAPGPGAWLIVSDIDAARAELIDRGADPSGVFHFTPERKGPVPGADPEGRSYRTFASFNDPDGNIWLLQEIQTRLPGRGFSNLDVAALTELLRETEKRHGEYEPTAPKHHWSGWYAAYMVGRQRGRTPEEAAKEAALHLDAEALAVGGR